MGHQNTQSFLALMEAVSSHALTEEKISPFLDSVAPAARLPRPPATHPRSGMEDVDRLEILIEVNTLVRVKIIDLNHMNWLDNNLDV